jgi:hypothetical protein
LPSSIVTIGNNSFQECASINNINILNGTIGNNAFNNCTSLTSVTLGTVTINNASSFDDDLKDAYDTAVSGGDGTGTYTKSGGSWSK